MRSACNSQTSSVTGCGDDAHIKSLLASVSASFPIGAVMLLQTGGEHIRFKPRPLAGTDEALRAEPETLVLDGQQRLTSLYQALMSASAVETKDAKRKPIRRWYYLDMKKAVEPEADREDAVLSVPEDRQVKAFGGEIALDVATPDLEYAADLFPVNRIFGSAEWRQAYSEHWNFDADRMRLFNDFESDGDQALRAIPGARDRAKEGDPEGSCLPGLRAR